MRELAAEGQLNPKLYDFIDTTLHREVHENFQDLVEDKIFKYKHRQMADDPSIFNRRMKRVVDRFWTRAETRDNAKIYDIYKKDEIEASVAQAALDPSAYKTTALDETNAHREYVVRESVAQYKDYYESDPEEI